MVGPGPEVGAGWAGSGFSVHMPWARPVIETEPMVRPLLLVPELRIVVLSFTDSSETWSTPLNVGGRANSAFSVTW